MNISARIASEKGEYRVVLSTDAREKSLAIAPPPSGFGSSVNGGELLFLALATCYCNDLYREARKRAIEIESVEIEVTGEFGVEGEPALGISYGVSVAAIAPQEEILALIRHMDTVAEIQNTLRNGIPVVLSGCEAREV